MTGRVFIVLACSSLLNTCAPAQVREPEPPLLETVTLNYIPNVGRIIVPSRYQGGVQLCIEDAMRQNAFACARLIDLRRVLPEMQYVDNTPAADTGK